MTFLEQLDRDVARARRLAAAAVDRVDAMVELRSIAFELQERQSDDLTLEDLNEAEGFSELRRARIAALFDRLAHVLAVIETEATGGNHAEHQTRFSGEPDELRDHPAARA